MLHKQHIIPFMSPPPPPPPPSARHTHTHVLALWRLIYNHKVRRSTSSYCCIAVTSSICSSSYMREAPDEITWLHPCCKVKLRTAREEHTQRKMSLFGDGLRFNTLNELCTSVSSRSMTTHIFPWSSALTSCRRLGSDSWGHTNTIMGFITQTSSIIGLDCATFINGLASTVY